MACVFGNMRQKQSVTIIGPDTGSNTFALRPMMVDSSVPWTLVGNFEKENL
jgi:hypothetical protein